MFGRLLLESGDPAWIERLETVSAAGPPYAAVAHDLAYAFLARAGERERAEHYRQRAVEALQLLEEIREERDAIHLSARDTFLPHDLDATTLAALRERSRPLGLVTRALAVRKQVRLWPERPLYIVALQADWRRTSERPSAAAAEMVQRRSDSLDLPGDHLVVTLDGRWEKPRKVLTAVSGAEVFVEHPATPRAQALT